MRKLYFTLLLTICGMELYAQYNFNVTTGATVTIQSGGTVYWGGNLQIDGNLSGSGMFQLQSPAQTVVGVGGINNLRVSNGAVVTPSNSITISNSLDVTAGSSLIIPASQYIVVNGPLTNAGTFNVNNDGSLVQAVGSTLTNSGTFNIQREGTYQSLVFNYISSPITTSSVPGAYRYGWNANASTQSYGDDQDPDPGWLGPAYNLPMVPGIGMAVTGMGLAIFSGTANNGNISAPMVYHAYSPGNTSPGTPFNLMGNPYPCAISASALISANPDVNGSIYFWDDDLSNGFDYSNSDYAVWNGTGSLGTGSGAAGVPNGYISTGQGFMIRSLNGGATLDFNNSMRMTGPNTQFFRLDEEPSRIWLSLEGTDLFNQILIGMIEDATDGEDRLYDAVKIRGQQDIAIAAVNEESEYAIMAFPPSMEEKTIPLNIFVASSGTYKFHSNTIEGFEGYDLYLEDRNDYSFYPLEEGTEVSFELAAGDHNERFYLHIGSQLVTDINVADAPNIKAWIYDGFLTVTVENINGKGQLELHDMSGKLVWASSSQIISDRTTVDLSDLSKGVYIVKLVSESGVYSKKVIR
jgi:hypothetical protein